MAKMTKYRIPYLGQIISNISLFAKYLAIYHCFETWVQYRTWVYENWVLKKSDMVAKINLVFYNLKVYVKFEFYKLKFIVM